MNGQHIRALQQSDLIRIGVLTLPIQLHICHFIPCSLPAVSQFFWLLQSLAREPSHSLFLYEDPPSGASSDAVPEVLR